VCVLVCEEGSDHVLSSPPVLTIRRHSLNFAWAAASCAYDVERCSTSSSSCFLTALSCWALRVSRLTVACQYQLNKFCFSWCSSERYGGAGSCHGGQSVVQFGVALENIEGTDLFRPLVADRRGWPFLVGLDFATLGLAKVQGLGCNDEVTGLPNQAAMP
jgi:hypothetical protein